MKQILAITEKEKSIAENFLESLVKFKGYNPQTDSLIAKVRENNFISLSYWSGLRQIDRDQHKLYIEIRENLGIVDWIQVIQKLQRRGYGSSLYNVTEKFFRNYGCKTVELTPSDTGKKYFWSKLGFIPKQDEDFLFEKFLD